MASHSLSSTTWSSTFIRPLPRTTTYTSSCVLCVWPYGKRYPGGMRRSLRLARSSSSALVAARNSKSGAPSNLEPRSSRSALMFVSVNDTAQILWHRHALVQARRRCLRAGRRGGRERAVVGEKGVHAQAWLGVVEPREEGQLLGVEGVAVRGGGDVGARKRIAHLQVVLAPRHLTDVAPRLGRVIAERIVLPLGHLVAERRDVLHAGEAAARLVVGRRVGLLAGGGGGERVVAEDAAGAGTAVEHDDAAQHEDRKRRLGHALRPQRGQQRAGDEVVPEVDVHGAGLLAAGGGGGELGRRGCGHPYGQCGQCRGIQLDVVARVDAGRRGLGEELGAPEDIGVLARAECPTAQTVGSGGNDR